MKKIGMLLAASLAVMAIPGLAAEEPPAWDEFDPDCRARSEIARRLANEHQYPDDADDTLKGLAELGTLPSRMRFYEEMRDEIAQMPRHAEIEDRENAIDEVAARYESLCD